MRNLRGEVSGHQQDEFAVRDRPGRRGDSDVPVEEPHGSVVSGHLAHFEHHGAGHALHGFQEGTGLDAFERDLVADRVLELLRGFACLVPVDVLDVRAVRVHGVGVAVGREPRFGSPEPAVGGVEVAREQFPAAVPPRLAQVQVTGETFAAEHEAGVGTLGDVHAVAELGLDPDTHAFGDPAVLVGEQLGPVRDEETVEAHGGSVALGEELIRPVIVACVDVQA